MIMPDILYANQTRQSPHDSQIVRWSWNIIGQDSLRRSKQMADVTVFYMSFARIFNAAVGSALFRVAAEDSCVNEILDLKCLRTSEHF